MQGDFSRDSYDPKKNFTRVLMQQGRLLVDADWNEQSEIVLHYLRSLAADIIGRHGGPGVKPGFKKPYDKDPKQNAGAFLVTLDANSHKVASISGGRYYVDGLLIENGTPAIVSHDNPTLKNQLVYLDVWERHIVAINESDLLDEALGGLDTASRTRLMASIHVASTDVDSTSSALDKDADLRELVINTTSKAKIPVPDPRPLENASLPQLAAGPPVDSGDGGDCVEKENGSGYTGLENQLYRVEVHHAGKDGKTFWDPGKTNANDAFTLKWSRDNGSVAYAATVENVTATLKTKWRDDSRAIRPGDWVELIALSEENGVLRKIKTVDCDGGSVSVTFELPKDSKPAPSGEIVLRRWDHRWHKDFPLSEGTENFGGILVKQNGTDASGSPVSAPMLLEDNIQITLTLPKDAEFRAGDYWLIPARAATGGILWPKDEVVDSKGNSTYLPALIPAKYTKHHYAPIAWINGTTQAIVDLRRNIEPIAK